MSALLPVLPPFELSEAELTRWYYYDDVDKVGRRRLGVKLRIIPVLFQFAYNTANFQNITSLRVPMPDNRSRLAALTFSGDVEFWRIAVTRNAQEYLIGGGQNDTFVHVTTLMGLPTATVSGQGLMPDTTGTAIDHEVLRPNGRPFQWDPTPLLVGSDELVFTTELAGAYSTGANAYYLNVGLWVWGFPNDGGPIATPRGV